MCNLVSVICLAVCLSAVADDTPPKVQPKQSVAKSSVSVQCRGRLRDGIVAIGGETTGTTITFNRIAWELQLNDDAKREFAKQHNKQWVVVTGTLRKVAGVETKDRWIVDVTKVAMPDKANSWKANSDKANSKTDIVKNKAKDKEQAQLTIRGILRAKGPGTGETSGMTIHADGHIWPIVLTSQSKLKGNAASLVGQTVLLTGSLEKDANKDSSKPAVIRVTTLRHSEDKTAGRSAKK